MIAAGEQRFRLLPLVFFGLTLLAVIAIYMLFAILSLPKGWLTAIVCIAVAELLIRRFRFSGTGIEAALWTGGLFALVGDLKTQSENLLLLAAASAIAGARVRNPYIGALASVFVVAYFGARHMPVMAQLSGVAIGAVALIGLAHEWQRPSTDRLMIVTLIAAPLTAAFAGESAPMAWSLAYFVLAIACMAVGVRLRLRSALIGGFAVAAIGTYAVLYPLPWPVQWKFIPCGVLLLALSASISRALRGKTAGFVVTPVKSAYDAALGVAAAAAEATPEAGVATQQVGGGGQFGGGGATGDY